MIKKERIKIGQITSAHGIKGNVKVYSFTDDSSRFEQLEWVHVEGNNKVSKLCLESVQFQKNIVIIKFKEINTRNEAEDLKNAMLLIDREMAVPLPQNTYFISDIIGMVVKDDCGEIIGNICDVLPTGGNDVYVIKDDTNKEILIPAIKDVVLKVDIENNYMIIKLLEGLIDKD